MKDLPPCYVSVKSLAWATCDPQGIEEGEEESHWPLDGWRDRER